MIGISSVSPDNVAAARDLFRSYGSFLRELPACHSFNFPRFETEILDLPNPYTIANGDLLLALADDGNPAGCIAFRAADAILGSHTCELKRLFVLPSHRGQGIAEHLVQAALTRALKRGYHHAVLDTEPSSMQAAHALYRKLGFSEFEPQRRPNPVNVVYLRRALV